MANPDDEKYLQAAIELAMRGRGSVEPNPMVGCVIVKDGRIIGSGYHQHYGSGHAEPNALASCEQSPAGATAYVTLEPCCHTDKQTPPCVPRLIEAKIARVVVGCLDPNPKVSGRGIRLLRDAGMEVDVGVCGDACRQLIAPFTAKIKFGRPYVTLKWAETADGKIAGPNNKRLAISGPAARIAVHQLRNRCDGILVGINTVLSDDPMLTVRGISPLRSLTRIVLDSVLRTPPTSELVNSAEKYPLCIYCAEDVVNSSLAEKLRERGATVIAMPRDESGIDLPAVMFHLWELGVMHLLVEPGPKLASSFFNSNLVDRLWVIRSLKTVNDSAAADAAMLPTNIVLTGECRLADDKLSEYLISTSPTFVGPYRSADFHLLSQATFPDQPG